jgi:competence protein ComFC
MSVTWCVEDEPVMLVDALFPIRCGACGAPGGSPCRSCLPQLRLVAAADGPTSIPWCATVVAPFHFEGPVRDLITALKYRGSAPTASFLAGRMAEAVVCGPVVGPRVIGPQMVVTWAPTAPVRVRRRGYDQAQVLAAVMARLLGLPCVPLLAHRSNDPRQTGLSRRERMGRSGRFAMLPAAPIPVGPTGQASSVLLVDDVMTTGATLTDAARVLRQNGVSSVAAVVAARVP